jgi:hypothetical protein
VWTGLLWVIIGSSGVFSEVTNVVVLQKTNIMSGHWR